MLSWWDLPVLGPLSTYNGSTIEWVRSVRSLSVFGVAETCFVLDSPLQNQHGLVVDLPNQTNAYLVPSIVVVP